MPTSTEQAERLILAAGGRFTDLTAAIDLLGAKEAGALAVEELTFRAKLPTNEHLMPIELVLTHGPERFTYTLEVQAGKPLTAVQGENEISIVQLEFDLTDLLRTLYGVQQERDAGTHRTQLLLERPAVQAAYEETLHETWYSIGRAVDTVLSGCSSRRPDLNELAVRYGSDKWGMVHWFTPHYDRHLRHLRNEPVRILEIGIGGYKDPDSGGESLKMWKAYFPRGVVTGVDVFAKHGLAETRVQTAVGDQSDPKFLANLVTEHGPFDVIVDDGSHLNAHVIISFDELLKTLRPGGFYIVEDLWTTYAPGFGGAEGEVSPPTTSIGMLKSLLDKLHYEERPGEPAGYPGEQIVGVHVYHNLAVIEKGVNAEGGIPSWVPHSFDDLINGPGGAPDAQ